MINPKDIIYIHIREGIPASGKTFTATNEIANTANTYWYFSHSNQTIDGIMLRFIELGLKEDIDFRVIRGINYKAKDMGEDVYCGGCLRYVGKDKRDLYLKHLIELNTPASMVCRICAYYDKQQKDIDKNYEPFEKSCLYRKQFKNYPRIVLSVINYMNTKYVDDSERDYLILDDVTSKGKQLKEKKFYEKWFNEYKTICVDSNFQYDNFEAFMKFLSEVYEGAGRETCEMLVMSYKSNIVEYLKTFEDATEVCNTLLTDPLELVDFARIWKVYDEGDKPDIPYLLDVQKKCQNHIINISKQESEWKSRIPFKPTKLEIIIIDAKINKYRIDSIFKDYNIDWKMRGGEKPKTTTIYRFTSNRYGAVAYSQGTVIKDKWLKNMDEQMLGFLTLKSTKPLNELTVGIISWKRLRGRWQKFGNQYFGKTIVNHYGNLRSQNEMEHVDVLFVIGNYSVKPEDIINKYKYWQLDKPKLYSNNNFDIWDSQGGHFNYKPLEDFCREEMLYEQYQAIHRSRMYIRDTLVVFASACPPWLEEEGTEISSIQMVKKKDKWDIVNCGENPKYTFIGNIITEQGTPIKDINGRDSKGISINKLGSLIDEEFGGYSGVGIVYGLFKFEEDFGYHFYCKVKVPTGKQGKPESWIVEYVEPEQISERDLEYTDRLDLEEEEEEIRKEKEFWELLGREYYIDEDGDRVYEDDP